MNFGTKCVKTLPHHCICFQYSKVKAKRVAIKTPSGTKKLAHKVTTITVSIIRFTIQDNINGLYSLN